MKLQEKDTENTNIFKTQIASLRLYGLAALMFWSFVIFLSLYVNYQLDAKHLVDIGTTIARSSFDKDILYRRWNAAQGGVYAKQSEITHPNPYLSVTERDIATPLGTKLTMVNPAYMTRQVHELGQLKNGIQGHITSLNPIRPENKPDLWEKQSLESFEQGTKEISSVEEMDGQRYFRWMRPLITETGCLTCHQQQGYEVGQIRGGISQSIPMSLLENTLEENRQTLWIKHIILWLIGCSFIYFSNRALFRKTLALSETNQRLGILATRDVLTGLSNRRHAMQLLERIWGESIKKKTPMACMLIDADGFKEINDRFGHDSGDLVLRELAKKLQYFVRTDDIVCRLGGDEFLIICPNTNEEGCMHIANLTQTEIAGLTISVPGGEWRGSISVGVGVKTDSMRTPEELVKAADCGVYAAKAAGKNCVRIAPKIDCHQSKRALKP